MDEVQYGLRPDGGTVVTLRKRLPALGADREPAGLAELGEKSE